MRNFILQHKIHVQNEFTEYDSPFYSYNGVNYQPCDMFVFLKEINLLQIYNHNMSRFGPLDIALMTRAEFCNFVVPLGMTKEELLEFRNHLKKLVRCYGLSWRMGKGDDYLEAVAANGDSGK